MLIGTAAINAWSNFRQSAGPSETTSDRFDGRSMARPACVERRSPARAVSDRVGVPRSQTQPLAESPSYGAASPVGLDSYGLRRLAIAAQYASAIDGSDSGRPRRRLVVPIDVRLARARRDATSECCHQLRSESGGASGRSQPRPRARRQRPIIVVMFVSGPVFAREMTPCRSRRHVARRASDWSLKRPVAIAMRDDPSAHRSPPIAAARDRRRRRLRTASPAASAARVGQALPAASPAGSRADVAAVAGLGRLPLARAAGASCKSWLRVGLVVRVEPLVDLVDVRPDDLLGFPAAPPRRPCRAPARCTGRTRLAMIWSRCVWPSSVTAKNVIAMHNSTPLAKPTKAPIWRSNSLSFTRSIAPPTTR